MHKNLILTSTKNLSREEWLGIRKIGGSDVATILNLNPYTPALRLFHEHIGLWKKEEVDNIHTYAGRVGEDFVEQYWWRYYDPENPDIETTLENAIAGRQIRKARKFNYQIVNPECPWLSANIDRLILKTKTEGRQGILEIKTALDNAIRRYEGGIPPQYILQMQTYMLVTGLQYAELAILVNGRFFDVYKFEANADIQKTILKKTEDFAGRVEQAKEVLASDLSQEDKDAAIAELEPEADGSDALEEYLKGRYRSDFEKVLDGTPDHLELCIQYLEGKEDEKAAALKYKEAGNKLKLELQQREANTIDFGKMGKATWTQDSRGIARFNIPKKLKQND